MMSNTAACVYYPAPMLMLTQQNTHHHPIIWNVQISRYLARVCVAHNNPGYTTESTLTCSPASGSPIHHLPGKM